MQAIAAPTQNARGEREPITAQQPMRWITLEHPTGGILLGSVLLAAITFLIGGIALRSLIALRQGTFLPAS